MAMMFRVSFLIASLAFVPRLLAEGVLINCTRPCSKEIAAVKQAGGTITYQYQHVDGIAADVPAGRIASLEKAVGADRLGKDEIIPNPAPVVGREGIAEAVVEADGVAEMAGEALAVDPANYPFNSQLTGVATLHSAGQIGTGVIIAIIDTGYRPVMQHVAPARIIGPGFNFVPGATEPPAISNLNATHGTQVAGMAAANIAFCFSAGNRFARTALDLGLVSQGPCAAGAVLVPMIGGAPGASIVPLKVFPASGAGSPNSRTIAAMDKVLDLRLKFNAGDPTGINIKVVNMSLGGPTNAAARTLSDQTVDKLLANDIVPVISAGNSGHSSVTGGSPGTSMSALTVGATATANHEWIYTAQFRAPCGLASTPLASVTNCAKTYRPDGTLQMASFSSRGPNHNGHTSPDVVANGSFDFTQGSGVATTVNFVSGTSFSSPTVAGIAATLRKAVPSATARQVRNALIMTANPNLIPTATVNDQGAGFVNAQAAFQLLAAGGAPDTVDLSSKATRNLQANMAHAGVTVYAESASVSFSGIRPSERAEVPLLVPDNTAKLRVRVRNIVPANAPAQQNLFFGDDVHLKIQSATVHTEDYFQFAPNVTDAFLVEGQEYNFTVNRPQAGVWRVTPTGDWTNKGTVSFDVDVWTEQESFPQKTASASINQSDVHTYAVVVPAGTAALNVRAEWANMSGNYPINDVDVTLLPPTGPANFACATGRTPELCSVANPIAGTWQVFVEGFSVSTFNTPGGKERYTLRVDADGTVLKPVD